MFISTAEKAELRISVRDLQAQNKELSGLVTKLSRRFDILQVHLIERGVRIEELENILKNTQQGSAEIEEAFDYVLQTKTAQAPWGYKKNGEPKMRPGPNSIYPHEVKK